MKTSKFAFYVFVAFSLTFLFESCGKEDLTETKVTPDTPNAVLPSGGIVDLGIVNGDIHHMSMSLSKVVLTSSGVTGGNPVDNSQINVELFSNADGIMSNATYSFSDSKDYSPMTFKTGTILISTRDASSFNSYVLNSGTIALVKNGENYYITLDGTLSNGDSIHGSFNGMLSYMDTVTTY